MNIIVNGRPVTISGNMLSYGELLLLAGLTGTPSVMWSLRDGGEPLNGTVLPGDLFHVGDGMVFNVVHTGNA